MAAVMTENILVNKILQDGGLLYLYPHTLTRPRGHSRHSLLLDSSMPPSFVQHFRK